ncbi:hypothetical protein FRC11_014933, partial [Ceratobasidium sp. 423]
MATHDITIDDGCPLITYSGDWNDSTNEDIRDQYWLNTYHSTAEAGASASFKFTGTAVYLYGYATSVHTSIVSCFTDSTNSINTAQSAPAMFVLCVPPKTELLRDLFEQGSYEVDIDGVSLGQFDGSSKSIENLALLAKAEGLNWGEHV